MSIRRDVRTALGSAFLRALHSKYESEPRIFDDSLAHLMLEAEEWAEFCEIFFDGLPEWELKRPIEEVALAFQRRSSLCAEILSRQRYAERALAFAVSLGVHQYAILGAGFDTFALRNRNSKLAIFEIDRPLVQQEKLVRIDLTNSPRPKKYSFLPMSFGQESLISVLKSSNIDPRAPVFFSWLGVTPYLNLNVIQSVLSDISNFCCPGSRLVFDYTSVQALDPIIGCQSTIQLNERLKEVGEPLQLCLEPSNVESLLKASGLRLVEHLSPAQIRPNVIGSNRPHYQAAPFVNFVVAGL